MFVYISAKTAYALGIGDWSSDVCSSDLPGREQGDHLRLADRRGGEDAGACRAALHFAHRQPFLPRQGAERIEPEAASADACPVRAVGGAALGNAIREGQGETEAGFLAMLRSKGSLGRKRWNQLRPSSCHRPCLMGAPEDRKSVSVGERLSVRVDL